MFFGVLFTSLGGLANLLANDLPLLVLVLLDGVEQGLAFVLGKFCVVHILVPMLLDTAFCACREGL